MKIKDWMTTTVTSVSPETSVKEAFKLMKKNGLATINAVLGKAFANEASAIEHMVKHKAETGLKFFETNVEWSPPDYIARAVR